MVHDYIYFFQLKLNRCKLKKNFCGLNFLKWVHILAFTKPFSILLLKFELFLILFENNSKTKQKEDILKNNNNNLKTWNIRVIIIKHTIYWNFLWFFFNHSTTCDINSLSMFLGFSFLFGCGGLKNILTTRNIIFAFLFLNEWIIFSPLWSLFFFKFSQTYNLMFINFKSNT